MFGKHLREIKINYYERFVGDFQRDTGHLSCTEIGVFDRLLDHYYATENPLPFGHADLCRIARAMDKIEQKAVKRITDEFFPVADDGMRHNARADKEIAKAMNRINSAKENGKKGGRPPKAKPDDEPKTDQSDNQTETQEKPTGFQSANPPETRSGVHHMPCTNVNPSTPQRASTTEPESTPAGLVCARLRSEARIPGVNPQHPKLLALLKAGLTADEIVSAGMDANGKGFAWVLAAAEGRRREASSVRPLPDAKPSRHSGFETIDYRAGVAQDGRF
jgi:uncharacterized protein YdaU (DUF1376 family)